MLPAQVRTFDWPWLRRLALVLLALATFVGIQTASLLDSHEHEHGGAHQHCCFACHSGHLPLLQTAALLSLAPRLRREWRTASADIPHYRGHLVSFHPSRAPPV